MHLREKCRRGYDLLDGYEKKWLILSSNPALDSIKIAKERHFANHSVGNVVSSDLKKLVPTYKNGE